MKHVSTLKTCAIASVLALAASHARANVYATDIKINGSLFGATNTITTTSPAVITYHLNQTADLGVSVAIVSGATTVCTISGGTARGLNTVNWGGTNSAGSAAPGGAYSVSITAKATGFTNWTQISVDNSNTVAVLPFGMDVDRNTNSPYYGRVVVGCATDGTANGITQLCGLYKANADGSPADEGAFGYAGYNVNDAGGTATGEMSTAGNNIYHVNLNPYTVRIGEDDRIYWSDNSGPGQVIAADMLATTNQIVIGEGPGPYPDGPSPAYSGLANNYSACPDDYLLDQGGWGIRQFDVAGLNSTNAAVYLVDYGDYPSWGIWMFHLTNGAADPADNTGTQCVNADQNTIYVTSAGVMVDDNLDVFYSQARAGAGDPLQRTFCSSNWNNGTLPPEGDGSSMTYNIPDVFTNTWAVGASDAYTTSGTDTAIDSRSKPKYVAVSMASGAAVTGGYNGKNGGIRLLNVGDGSVALTNIDLANWYDGVAFDNVGNLYGASRSTNYWRTWTPPGASTNTTQSIAKLQLITPVPFKITSTTVTSAGGGFINLTINFTASSTLSPSSFTLLGSSTVNGTYSSVPRPLFSNSGTNFTVTATVSPGINYFTLSHN